MISNAKKFDAYSYVNIDQCNVFIGKLDELCVNSLRPTDAYMRQ